MANVNVKEIEKVALKFNNDVELINKELKRIASVKCRLLKQKGRHDYAEKLDDCLAYYQVLVEAKNLLQPKDKFVTQFEQEDVEKLDYDETIKAIRSIQSKKTLSKWLTENEGDNDEYRNAERIEKMLIEHRNNIKPVDEAYIRKSDVQTIIDTIKSSGKLSQAKIVELLESLM